MRPADWAKRERARIVEFLRTEAVGRDAEAEAAITQCPASFGARRKLESERNRREYQAKTALAFELRRVAYLIEAEKVP